MHLKAPLHDSQQVVLITLLHPRMTPLQKSLRDNVSFFLWAADIQEFYEVTLLDSQRCAESSKPVDGVALWEFSSLQSATVTSDTLPSLSTSIEVRFLQPFLPCNAQIQLG